jgi:hypothetical protein
MHKLQVYLPPAHVDQLFYFSLPHGNYLARAALYRSATGLSKMRATSLSAEAYLRPTLVACGLHLHKHILK